MNETESITTQTSTVHIRIQQRNGKKSWTTIHGLTDVTDEPDFMKIMVKCLRKALHCTVTEKTTNGQKIIEMFGDHREKVKELLIKDNIVTAENIKIHGY